MGALPEYLPVQRSVPLCEARALLERAAAGADAGDARELAVELLTRLDREFPALEGRQFESGDDLVFHAAVSAGAEDRDGIGAPGLDEFDPHRTGTLILEGSRGVVAELDAGILAGRYFAARVEPVFRDEKVRFGTLEGVVGLGRVALTVGRGQIGFGTAAGGGVVLGGARFDRIQIETPAPLEMHGFLSPLGRVGFTTFLAPIREERHRTKPFFWGTTVSLQPHWRTTFYVHRGTMVRGDGEFPFTAANIARLLVGSIRAGGFENQIVSMEGRFHLPTESVIPLTAYLEWGAEDAAGGWWDVPARIIGLEIPMVPGAPRLSLGMERTSFGQQCCGNPMWYRHWSFPGSWVVEDRPLGHPLGGNGTEWLVFSGLDLPDARGRVDLRAFHRDRGPDNLYTPGREGSSWGGAASFRWRMGAGPEIFGAARFESGSGWSEHEARLAGRITIGG